MSVWKGGQLGAAGGQGLPAMVASTGLRRENCEVAASALPSTARSCIFPAYIAEAYDVEYPHGNGRCPKLLTHLYCHVVSFMCMYVYKYVCTYVSTNLPGLRHTLLRD